MPAIRYRDPVTGQTIPLSAGGATGPQGPPGPQGPVGPTGPPGTTDHGAQTGLADDDHPQYHNDARGDARYLNVTGDTATGDMVVFKPNANLRIDGSGTAGSTASLTLKGSTGTMSRRIIESLTGGLLRWSMRIGDNNAESGGNAGSNFVIYAYDDTGALLSTPLQIIRANGAVMLAADPVAALQATTKQYCDRKVLKTGDTMTGPLVLPGDPTLALHAVPRQYLEGGSASFTLTASAANGTVTVCTSGLNWGNLITVTGGKLDLTRTGFYTMTSLFTWSSFQPTSTQRAFLDITQTGDIQLGRASYGVGENSITCTASFYVDAPTQVWSQVFQNSGSAQAGTGRGFIKFIGRQ